MDGNNVKLERLAGEVSRQTNGRTNERTNEDDDEAVEDGGGGGGKGKRGSVDGPGGGRYYKVVPRLVY